MELDENLDMTVMIVLVALFLTVMMPNVIKMYKNDFGGFGTQIEKTALKTSQSLPDIPMTYKKEDIILMVAVTDEYEQEPKAFDIDGLSLTVDGAFLQNRIPPLVSVNNKLNDTDYSYKLSTTPGTNKAINWKFSRIN